MIDFQEDNSTPTEEGWYLALHIDFIEHPSLKEVVRVWSDAIGQLGVASTNGRDDAELKEFKFFGRIYIND